MPCLFMLLQAPDCKHGLGSKIKIGLCAMDKKVRYNCSRSSSSKALEWLAGSSSDSTQQEAPALSWLCSRMMVWR
jgi:hypothetical protein